MKGEENHFRKGLFISLGLHLLLVCLLSLGVGSHGKISPEHSIEVSFSTHAPRADGKKSAVKAPNRSPKPKKSAKKKIKKAPREQVESQKKEKARPVAKEEKSPKAEIKPPEKLKEPVATPKETAAERNPIESGKREVIRGIKKESILKNIGKTAGEPSAETPSKQAGPGLISLVLDVYYKTISKRIQRSLILPPNIDSSASLSAQVNFHMKENGEVYDVGIERSSGNGKFDSYCIKAVTAASPLPSPPTELRDRIKSEFFIISCEGKE